MTETLGNKTEIILHNMDNMLFETERKFQFIYAEWILYIERKING